MSLWSQQLLSPLVKCATVCIDIESFNTNPGATVRTFPCGRGSKLNQDFVVSADSIKSMQTPPTCLAVIVPIINGTGVTTAECSASDPNQELAYSAASGEIVHVPSGLCLDSGSPLPPQVFCSVGDHASWPFCDPNTAIDDRVADIVSRLSLADKISALGTQTPFLSSVGMNPYQWCVRLWGV